MKASQISKLAPGKHKDPTLPAFGVRVSPKGKVAFIVDARIDGQRTTITIGQWPVMDFAQAKFKAMDILKEIRENRDPRNVESKNDGIDSFRKLAEAFREKHLTTLKPTTARNYNKDLIFFVEKWGDRTSLEKQEIRRWFASEKKPVMANRKLATLSSVLSRGVQWGLWEINHAVGIDKNKETPRKARLTIEQLKKLVEIVREMPPKNRIFFMVLIRTACRSGEVFKMKWENIRDGVWTKENTKNGKDHQVKLDGEVLAALSELGWKDSGPVLEVFDPRYPWRKVQQALDSKIHIHDLRRSIGTALLNNDVPVEQVSALLGHSSVAITQKVYAEFVGDNAVAVNRIGALLD